jgi:hypothetical protein
VRRLGSSTDAVRDLGAYLTGTEARQLADRLEDDDPLSMALVAVDTSRRSVVGSLIKAIGFQDDQLVPLLRAIQGARSVVTTARAIWTMPGHLVSASALTTSTADLVAKARVSIVCSTFNFQATSGLWHALRHAAARPELTVKVYIDAGASSAPTTGPDAHAIAAQLFPAAILRTREIDGRPVRNHAKFVSVDHRFLVVTSANYSWSAENRNIELGVVLDDPALAEEIESQLRDVEHVVYERLAM